MMCVFIAYQALTLMKNQLYAFYGIVALGMCLLLGGVWKSLSKQGLFISIVFAIGLFVAAKMVPYDLAYRYLGIEYALKPYEVWIAINFFIGIPVMTFIFNKFEE